MGAFYLSRLLANVAWAFFWGAFAVFLVVVLGAAIYFAPWPLKVVALMLLVSGALFSTSAGIDFWRQRH